jgi:tRNA(fMet)-specific endonuclease VapC
VPTTASSYVILDTDVFCYLFAKRPQAAHYGPLLRGKIPALAFVSVAETRFAALAAGWGEHQKTELEASLRKCLTLPFDEELAFVWARLKYDAQQKGHHLAQAIHTSDLWIAASGLYYDTPILTRRIHRYEGLGGIRLINGS